MTPAEAGKILGISPKADIEQVKKAIPQTYAPGSSGCIRPVKGQVPVQRPGD